jgi:cytochrome c
MKVMKYKLIILASIILALIIISIQNNENKIKVPINNINNINNRWFTQDQVDKGNITFQNNCAICHGPKANKIKNWKKTLADGSYPPPPLNGNAHSWHHPYTQLFRIIKNGGKSYDGKMPAFRDKLSDEEIQNVISYFQNMWSDEKYSIWIKNGGVKK